MTDRETLKRIIEKAAFRCLPSITQLFHINMLTTELLANGVVVREKGEWGAPFKVDADNIGRKCSQCGEFGVPCFNFCPNCGADMRKGENG